MRPGDLTEKLEGRVTFRGGATLFLGSGRQPAELAQDNFGGVLIFVPDPEKAGEEGRYGEEALGHLVVLLPPRPRRRRRRRFCGKILVELVEQTQSFRYCGNIILRQLNKGSRW